MDVFSAVAAAVFLLAAAAGLMALHLRAWRAAKRRLSDGGELDFRFRQYRRRMQTSGMLGVLAIAILLSPWITGPTWWVLAFWGAVLLVLGWMALLAMVDLAATQYHFARLQHQAFLEHAKLRAELRGEEEDSR